MLNTTFQSPKVRKKRFTTCCAITLTVLISLLINGCIIKEGIKTGDENICNDCNIILIIVDTLRADHLPCYGYYRNTAPHICELAKEGVLFENAFAQSANTFPSHMSIFTSLYPSSHGVKNIFKDKLDEEILTLPQILKLYDYNTAWSGPLTDPALDFEAGFGRGFDEKFNSVFRKYTLDECNNSKLFEWLEKQEKERNNFFLFYHTYKVHVPYIPQMNIFDNRSILNITLQDYSNKRLQILKLNFCVFN